MEFEADFICSLCCALGENASCAWCGARACEACLRTCCSARPPLPKCARCPRRAEGFWSCFGCGAHVCRFCAPTDKAPPGFQTPGRCQACARAERARVELALLAPTANRLPPHLRLLVERAVA